MALKISHKTHRRKMITPGKKFSFDPEKLVRYKEKRTWNRGFLPGHIVFRVLKVDGDNAILWWGEGTIMVSRYYIKKCAMEVKDD